MSLTLTSTGKLGKSLAVKRETRDDDTEVVVCTLGLSDVFVERDQLDELSALPVGWSSGALYDEGAAPLAPLAITPHRGEWTASGVISGGHPAGARAGSIRLKDAEVSALALDLTKLGALASFKLTWDAVGDEVEDLTDLLGRECRLTLSLSNSGQGDLLSPLQRLVQPGSGITSVEIRDGDGKKIAEFGVKEGATVTGFNAAMSLLEDGWHLVGVEPNFSLELLDDGKLVERRSVWVNAAKSCIKRGNLQRIDGHTDAARWCARTMRAA